MRAICESRMIGVERMTLLTMTFRRVQQSYLLYESLLKAGYRLLRQCLFLPFSQIVLTPRSDYIGKLDANCAWPGVLSVVRTLFRLPAAPLSSFPLVPYCYPAQNDPVTVPRRVHRRTGRTMGRRKRNRTRHRRRRRELYIRTHGRRRAHGKTFLTSLSAGDGGADGCICR